MFINDYMSKNPYCITKDTTVSKALEIMSQYNFRRIPVVDENKVLIGLVTESTISENTPSNATSLSIYELNYLISKTKVEDIMVRKVNTVKKEMLLEEAALMMRNNNVQSLVVVDDDLKVEGIITQNDIFDAFIDILGYYRKGIRFEIKIKEDSVGVLNKITNIFYVNNANILDVTVFHNSNIIDVVILASTNDPDLVLSELEKNGYKASAELNEHVIN